MRGSYDRVGHADEGLRGETVPVDHASDSGNILLNSGSS